MKNYVLAISIMSLSFHAQVGINTKSPSSTVTVNGSFGADYKEIASTNYTITSNDHYLTYNGTGNSTFTLPSIKTGTANFAGRIYKIKNISASNLVLQANNGNTLRIDNTPIATFIIPTGAYAEVVNNSNTSGGTWDLSYTVIPKARNVELYGNQLSIPPHSGVQDWNNHSNKSYDTGIGTDAWWVISKSSTPYSYTDTYSVASRMTIVYEYQGTPFNTSNLYPILTAGNNSSYPDIFSASYVSLANNGTSGKTRLTVTVSRVDLIGNNGNSGSNWGGTFLLNMLLARKVD